MLVCASKKDLIELHHMKGKLQSGTKMLRKLLKTGVLVKFQAPSSPIQCGTKSSRHEQHSMGEGCVADGFDSLLTDI